MADAHGGHGDAHGGAGAHGGGHGDAHGGGSSQGGGWGGMWTTKHTDNWDDWVATVVSEQVSTFVAFIFFIITVGAVYGALVAARNPTMEPFLLIVPAVLGLIAFYNRDIATLFFLLFTVGFILV